VRYYKTARHYAIQRTSRGMRSYTKRQWPFGRKTNMSLVTAGTDCTYLNITHRQPSRKERTFKRTSLLLSSGPIMHNRPPFCTRLFGSGMLPSCSFVGHDLYDSILSRYDLVLWNGLGSRPNVARCFCSDKLSTQCTQSFEGKK
jgi:hypothetical protein